MAKHSHHEAADTAAIQTISLDDIPDEMPLLAPGRWAMQFVSFKVRTFESKSGPMTTANIALDPLEPVSVDEPGEDYTDMRQYHTLWLNRPKDMIAAKQFLKAFGVTSGVAFQERAEDGSVTYPAFEAARGEAAHATAIIGIARGGRDKGKAEVQLTDFTAAA